MGNTLTKCGLQREPPAAYNNNECIRIVMVGKTGAGKSATGNTILGRNVFKSELFPGSVTTFCEKATGEVDGQKVAVIDTPGLFDTKNAEEEINKDIVQSISYASPGPHIFLVVIKLGRFTDEEKHTVEMIQEIFGEEANKYSMVLFTHGDLLKGKTIEDLLKDSKDMRELVAKCNSQYHVFNNEVKDRSQVSKLLKKIRNINAQNGGSYYTTEIFQNAARAIEEEKQQILREKEEEKQQILKEKEEEKQQILKEKEEEKQQILKEKEEEKQQILKEKEEEKQQILKEKEEEIQRILKEKEENQRILKEREENQRILKEKEEKQQILKEKEENQQILKEKEEEKQQILKEKEEEKQQILKEKEEEIQRILKEKEENQRILKEKEENQRILKEKEENQRILKEKEEEKQQILKEKEEEKQRILKEKEEEKQLILKEKEEEKLQILKEKEEEKLRILKEKEEEKLRILKEKEEEKLRILKEKEEEKLQILKEKEEEKQRILKEKEEEKLQILKEKEEQNRREQEKLRKDMEEKNQQQFRDVLSFVKSTLCTIYNNNELIRIVMVGKTGAGKSATGNTILGQKSFKSDFAAESLTKVCKKAYGEVDGQKVAVIDTPGLFDTKNAEEETAKDIAQSISYASPGPHIFLVIIKLGRFTEEEKQTVEKIQEIFGEKANKYSMVLFTHGDQLKGKPIEEFLKRSKDLQGFVAKCNNQYHVFNNELEDRSQVRELLDKIRNINAKNGGSYYTTDMFQKAERAIEEEKQRILKEKEEQNRKQQEKLMKEIEEKYERLMSEHRDMRKQLSEACEREKEELAKEIKQVQEMVARQEAEKETKVIQRFIKFVKRTFTRVVQHVFHK